MFKKSVTFDDFSITVIKANDYRIRFWVMAKDEAASRKRNSGISETLDNCGNEKIKIILYIFCFNGTPVIKYPQKCIMIKIKSKLKIIIAIIEKLDKKKTKSIMKIKKKGCKK